MTQQIDRKAARRILAKHRGAKTVLANELGVKLCAVSLWLKHGGKRLSVDKQEYIQRRAAELSDYNSILTEKQQSTSPV